MFPPIPYGVRALALSHARAWPTAFWTASATALAADLILSPSEWFALAGLAVLCGTAVRTVAAQLVDVWLGLHPEARAQLRDPSDTDSEYDSYTHHALSSLA